MTTAQPCLPSIGAGEYFTPGWLFDELSARFGPFTLDAAAQPDSAKCAAFFDLESDGLSQPWSGVVWCNPPYSDVIVFRRAA